MATQRRTANHRAKTRRRNYWVGLTDAALLELRFCDLHLSLPDSIAQPDVQRLYAELGRRGLRFRPHAWLSEEWFSPDGVPGIAIPFFAAHPRLRQLERTVMGDVDGGSRNWRIRLLRHEAGHAVDNAYRLRRRADWRGVFGYASRPYPGKYTSRPASLRHVRHLANWYAQSHPTEDFAETFAIWLQPKARWRRDYQGWPALDKLEFVDRLMAEIADTAPRVRNRETIEPLSTNTRTLGEYYQKKRAKYDRANRRYDAWLARIFAPRAARPRAVSAGAYLRELEPRLRRSLVQRDYVHPYLADHVISLIEYRVRQLNLVLRGARRDSLRSVVRLHERVASDVLRRNREHHVI